MPDALSTELAAQLAQVPRGNTQKHVNRDVLAYLLTHEAARLGRPGLRWLDAPCGEGEFLTQVRRFWPQADLSGTDVRAAAPTVPGAPVRYAQADLSQGVPFANEAPFEVLTSISGIMCFANTAQFIGDCAQRLAPGGLLLAGTVRVEWGPDSAVREVFNSLVVLDGAGTVRAATTRRIWCPSASTCRSPG